MIMYYKINKYCYKLSKLVKNYNDKYDIVNEIKSHMEEYVTNLVDKGLTESEAQNKAIKDMGNTYILAYKLNKSHKSGILPEINYYENNKIKPVLFFHKSMFADDNTNPSVVLPQVFTSTNYLTLIGFTVKDIIKYCLISLLIIATIGNILIFSYKQNLFRMYGLSDVYSFGKVYNIEHIEKTKGNNTVSYVYNKNSITVAQIEDYKKLLKEQGYNEVKGDKFYKCINEKGDTVELNIENGKFIITLNRQIN